MNPSSSSEPTALDRAGHLLAARLDEGLPAIGADITERLRFARERAVARARHARLESAATAASAPAWAGQSGWALAGPGGAVAGRWSFGDGRSGNGRGEGSGWTKLVSALPLLILALGFLAIQDTLVEHQILAAAEVDAALLTDDLPPQAYSDPGFAEFLRRQDR